MGNEQHLLKRGNQMINVLSFSEVGGHRLNEDAFVVQEHPSEPGLWLCFVADGQGGQAGGGLAARLACQVALEAVLKCPPESLSKPRTWSSIFQMADEAVRTEPAAGFTTLVGLCVSQDWLVGAANGDSAAVLLCGGQVTELTHGQHKNPPIGSGGILPVPFSVSMSVPWRLLVMSDGVWKYASWERVFASPGQMSGAELLVELQQAARLPRTGQFQDDFTVVLLEEANRELRIS